MSLCKVHIEKVWLITLLSFFIGSSAAEGSDGKENATTRKETKAAKSASNTRVKLAGVSVGGFYSHYSDRYSRYYYPYHPLIWDPVLPYWYLGYDLYGPIYNPGSYRDLSRLPGMGEIKLRTEPKGAQVFLNGAYAGAAEDLKSIRLQPGAYDLEIKLEGLEPFKRRIYVLTGRILKIQAKLTPERREVKP